MNEIVIKVSDELLSFVYQNGFVPSEKRDELNYAILECVELPEGHDRLIDAKVAQSYLYNNMNWFDKDGYITDDEEKDKALQNLVDGIPSVVDADKE